MLFSSTVKTGTMLNSVGLRGVIQVVDAGYSGFSWLNSSIPCAAPRRFLQRHAHAKVLWKRFKDAICEPRRGLPIIDTDLQKPDRRRPGAEVLFLLSVRHPLTLE